jgi:predicted glycoside hydrolase/deacetylase ChbG (UPF0249 family)
VKRLLVVADDLGLTPGVNAGIAQGFRDGILTSASFLTNTPHFDATVKLLPSLPGLKVGIHLTLVGGSPVLPPGDASSLVTRAGVFRASWRQFLPAWLSGRVHRNDVAAEWRAQVRRALEAGIRPAHLDSHQHLHVIPGLWSLALDLGQEFSIPRLRLPCEITPAPPGTPIARRFVRRCIAGFGSKSRSTEGVCHCDHFFGISETGRLDSQALLAVLRRIPDGWSELITHPGIPDEELRRDYPWGYQWAEEARALCSDEVKGELSKLRITLDRP